MARMSGQLGADGAAAHTGVPPRDDPAGPRIRRPAVAVIIPTYNDSRYLGEAIASVLAQTCRDFEIVVVDDGSRDDPGPVVVAFPAVKLVRQDNQGLAAARNTGIRESCGRYLVFLDADDRLLPGALDAGLACFEAFPQSAFVSGGYCNVGPTGERLGTPMPAHLQGDAYCALLHGNYIGMNATVMFRRDAVEAAGGFDARLRACEDYDLYLRLARRHAAHTHAAIIAEYRRHSDNMSHDPVLMADHVLAVLGRQWPYVARDRRLRHAYRAGQRAWRGYYGRKLAAMLVADLRRNGDPAVAARQAVRLMRLAPSVLLLTGFSIAARRSAAYLRAGWLAAAWGDWRRRVR